MAADSPATTCQAPMSRSRLAPKTNSITRITPNAPALTTATAWSSALTGVGATIAAGSQLCSGMTAALTLTPPMSRTNSPRPARVPPATGSAPTAVTTSTIHQTMTPAWLRGITS